MITHPQIGGLTAVLFLSACAQTGDIDVSRAESSSTVQIRRVEADQPGKVEACEAKDTSPAIIETITEQVVISPAEWDDDDTLIKPAQYETVQRQQIVEARETLWFPIPCPQNVTPEFIASVQRALAARGLYAGRITGEIDTDTRRAIRAYQAPRGLNSDVLSLQSAKELGLSIIDFG